MDIKVKIRQVIYMIKASIFLRNIAITNNFLSINSTCLVLSKVSTMIKDLKISFFLGNKIFALLKIRKIIFITNFILMSVNKKVF